MMLLIQLNIKNGDLKFTSETDIDVKCRAVIHNREILQHIIFILKKKYPEIQFETSNGITLCKKCHEKTYGKEEQFITMLVRVVQTMDD